MAEAAAALKALAEAAARQAEALDVLSDIRDKLWDAEGNNHVGMIFKSMEWRVDRLAIAAEDAAVLLKTFASLQDELHRLLAAVQDKNLSTPALIAPLIEPLEEGRYLRFENRFRGPRRKSGSSRSPISTTFRRAGGFSTSGAGGGSSSSF